MTKKQSIDFYNALVSLKDVTGVKFLYAVAKNIRALTPEIESFNNAMEMDDDMKDFDKKRVALAESNAVKDEKGKPIIVNNTYLFEDEKTAEECFQDLKSQYPEVVEKREKQMKEFNDFLQNESDINLYKVKLCDVPNEIKQEQLTAIIDMIEE